MIKYLNTSGEIVKLIAYDYEFENDLTQSVSGRKISSYQYENNNQLTYFHNLKYSIAPEFNRLKRTTTKNYSAGEIESETIVEENLYSDVYNNLVIESKTVFGNGDESISRMSYVGTIAIGGNPTEPHAAAIVNMFNQGKVATPIEQITYLKKAGSSQLKPLLHKFYLYKTLATGKVVLDKIVKRLISDPQAEVHDLAEISPSGEFGYSFDAHHDLYQEFSAYQNDLIPVEIKNENFDTSTILLNSDDKVIASISNGSSSKSLYTSFEEGLDFGGWEREPVTPPTPCPSNPPHAITGDSYYCLGGGNIRYPSNIPQGSYLLTFWYKGGLTINMIGAENIVTTEFQEGEWTYKEVEFEIDNNTTILNIGGTALIDELRLSDVNATMNTKGYYADGKLKYECSPAGDVVTYEYDAKGRLEWVLNRTRNVVEHHSYVEKDISILDSYNKHITSMALKETKTKNDVLTAPIDGNNDIIRSVTFTDGLGRFRQSFNFNVNGGSDQINFAGYDSFGRETKKYLPYWSSGLGVNSNIIADPVTDQASYYTNLTGLDPEITDAYVATEIEKSPLQRPVQQGGIGTELQLNEGHTTEMEYGWNTSADQVLKWQLSYDVNHKATISATGSYYPSNHLTKTTITNAEGKVSMQFKDAMGRLIANSVKARVNTSGGIDYTSPTAHNGLIPIEKTFTSYTVYDDFGRVVCEIPAIAVERMNGTYHLNEANPSAVFQELITYYKYDQRGRVIEKSTPGQGLSSFVYDRKNRIVMSQDSQQASENKWSFIKRDTRGRVCLKGEKYSGTNRLNHQETINSTTIIEEEYIGEQTGSIYEYSNLAYPTIAEWDVLNVYYFDRYDFDMPSNFTVPSQYLEVSRGLPTGSKTRILNPDGTLGEMLATVSYYDTKRRPFRSFTENHKEGRDQVNTYYNEYGEVEKIIQYNRYEENSQVVTFQTRFEYEHKTRKLRNTYCKVGSDPEVLVSTKIYSRSGQLTALNLHKPEGISNFMQYMNYRYNAQGQLTHINDPSLAATGGLNDQTDDVFGQQLVYFNTNPSQDFEYDQSSSAYTITPKYDGNISAMLWNAKSPDEDGTTLSRNAYIYEYYDFGQMTGGFYAADNPAMPGEYNEKVGFFNETIEYDLGGNIKALGRNSYINEQTTDKRIDSLAYTYHNNGFRTKKITDVSVGGHTPV